MAARVVYNDVVEGAELEGELFAGKKFWVAQRCPSRTHYLGLIKANGGQVVMLEKLADYLIAGHPRRDCPPGSISYKFIEESIKLGEIDDPDKYSAGPALGTAREAGSLRPTKSGRIPFNADEDRILYKWVKDHVQHGGSESGNELYKQLEAKYPRHPWQSWRDRYIKHLRDRPPSSFSIPENAPPSPPSDQSAEQLPPSRLLPQASMKPTENRPKTKAKPPQQGLANALGETSKRRRSGDYTIGQLERLFSKEDWEELYANVERISSVTVGEYLPAWGNWAGGTSQTAEQWKQYFEKVVLPQWQKDPQGKKDQVTQRWTERKAREKEDEDVPETASAGPSTPKANHPQMDGVEDEASPDEELVNKFLRTRKGKDASIAYAFFSRERKYAVWEDKPGLTYQELHKVLLPQYLALSEEEKAPYLAKEAADKRRYEIENEIENEKYSQVRSSPTLVSETPQYIAKAYGKAMKRIRAVEEGLELEAGESSSPRPAKRQKQSPVRAPRARSPRVEVPGTQKQPVDISSGTESSSLDSQDVGSQPKPIDTNMEDVIQAQLQTQKEPEDEELDDADKPTPTTESDDFQILDQEQFPSDTQPHDRVTYPTLPSNTPTPRPSRHKPSNFDTQAILSSPSQGLALAALPRPHPRSRSSSASISASSPFEKPASISTTASLHAFRHSVASAKSKSSSPRKSFSAIPPPLSSSPAPSESSSTNSADPDPPLCDHELDPFVLEQETLGFTEQEILAALNHTRLRPELAATVLEAWKTRGLLPDQRGVWSEEDDYDVEGGDGVELARLEQKHSLDGWGGITERLRWLEGRRRRAVAAAET
ncbi:hypothetical protein BCR34DRAFT_635959 [Clohesyomyces aquaticus]|uniref:DNA-binding protein RAP1 n=1 Tax=Clohesyomyces aquaticus TaxID=1231657 RepID=A0A1Y1YXM3_9PLEO|nr:hypothetical protein BCR34DRAFT_635959 [Clohesyomyces aquaticus]